MKTKVLIIAVLLISIAMFSTGAYAYFTATATVTGNIKSGTLDLKIAGVQPSAPCPASITGETATLWVLDNLAPGDVVTGKLCMKNTGSLPIPQVGFNWVGMSGNLAEHLFVTKLINSRTGVDEIADYIAYYDRNHDGNMSLAELNDTNYAIPSGVMDEWWVGGNPVFLPVGATEWVEYTFVFDPTVGNELQGASFDYTLAITGFQTTYNQAVPAVHP